MNTIAERRRILVVEDDEGVRELVEDCLSEAGFLVTCVTRGSEAIAEVGQRVPDLVILDLGLPDMDGLALVQRIRLVANPGMIILSGRSGTVERIVGLEVGADDYICKPFEPRELVARAKSVLRRLEQPAAAAAQDNGRRFRFDGFELDVDKVVLTGPDGQVIPLSGGEFGLLRAMVERPNRVLTRDQLLDLTHVNDLPAFDRSIDVQVARLRKKIEPDPKDPRYIKTMRNQGYIFTARVTTA